MKLHSIIMDNFFDNPDEVREELLAAPIADLKSPVDGVVYPNIIAEQHIPNTMLKMLTLMKTVAKDPVMIFARLSLLGDVPPHQAHNDEVMGDCTALVYMSLPKDCKGGTCLVEHILQHPPTPERWQKDTNSPEMWKVVGRCPMAYNRLFLFRSSLYHRAAPLEGFGKTIHDGRLVLTMFFNPHEGYL